MITFDKHKTPIFRYKGQLEPDYKHLCHITEYFEKYIIDLLRYNIYFVKHTQEDNVVHIRTDKGLKKHNEILNTVRMFGISAQDFITQYEYISNLEYRDYIYILKDRIECGWNNPPPQPKYTMIKPN